jgi:hypothetical protein
MTPMTPTKSWLSFFAAAALALAPVAVHAQAAAAPPAPAGDAAPKVKVEKGAGGKKIYRITDEIRIEGKIQKPEAFFFYQKSSINYDWQELKQDFIPKILDSVSRSPF